MERRMKRSVALAVTFVVALASLAMAAPKSERISKYLTIEGRVLHKSEKARTLIVSDMWSKKLYLVNVPEGASLRITFGMNAKTAEPGFENVRRNDRVRFRCTRTGEHLAKLDDGTEVVVLTADN